ncbi:hypothetical protein [Natrinema soli]|uniref:hypothetical protein n=1 Tax=Natrinema soli TaxID=1930624 RepID=UPI0023613001|nr:hypothetical protein [Natrinema soli]
MCGLPVALPTLEVLPVRALASRALGTGILDGLLERNRWHQPDGVVCVLMKGLKTSLIANPAPGFVVEERRALDVVTRLGRVSPRRPLMGRREQLFAALR